MHRAQLLLVLSATLLTSSAFASRPPPTPPPAESFASRLAGVREDALAAGKLLERLQGEAKTVVELQRRLDRMVAELEGLERDAATAAVVVPVIGTRGHGGGQMDPIVPAWNGRQPVGPEGVPGPVTAGPIAMNDADFRQVIDAASKQSFGADKLRVLRAGLKHKPVSVAQVRAAIDLFAFSGEKLELLAWLSPQIVDRDQRFQLFDAFTFPSDKEKADEILR